MKEQISYDQFDKIDLRIGTVISVKKNEKARKPSLVVKVDFGKEIGIKQSSAQITHYYNEENLMNKQVINLFLRLFGKLISLIKKKDKIILKFKKGTVNLKKTSNFLKANTYQINNKDYKILVSRNLFKIYSRKKLIISKKIDKKNNYYVFKEIEKSFFNKKNKLCKVNEAIETQKIIKKINMLK